MGAPDLAVFDLDGTLTRRDTFLPFLRRVAGSRTTAMALARSFPALAAACRDRARRDAFKEALVGATLGARESDGVDRMGAAYAEHLLATQLRPDTLARLRWHQAEGHDCVIVSASLTVYVAPLAKRLGVDRVVATELEVGSDGRLTGRFVGPNCRAAEKLRRIEAAYGDRPIGWAYGDSVDDQIVLDRAAARDARRQDAGRRRRSAVSEHS